MSLQNPANLACAKCGLFPNQLGFQISRCKHATRRCDSVAEGAYEARDRIGDYFRYGMDWPRFSAWHEQWKQTHGHSPPQGVNMPEESDE